MGVAKQLPPNIIVNCCCCTRHYVYLITARSYECRPARSHGLPQFTNVGAFTYIFFHSAFFFFLKAFSASLDALNDNNTSGVFKLGKENGLVCPWITRSFRSSYLRWFTIHRLRNPMSGEHIYAWSLQFIVGDLGAIKHVSQKERSAIAQTKRSVLLINCVHVHVVADHEQYFTCQLLASNKYHAFWSVVSTLFASSTLQMRSPLWTVKHMSNLQRGDGWIIGHERDVSSDVSSDLHKESLKRKERN